MTKQGNRDSLYDNVKGVLIVLVVIKHFWGALRSYAPPPLAWTEFAICAAAPFLIPLFMFISGYFSKKVKDSSLMNLLVVYYFCQVVLGLYTLFFRSGGMGLGKLLFTILLRPFFSMWFYVALILLRMLAPALSKLRYSVLLLAVLGIAAVGVKTDNAMDVALVRTVTNAPYFALGLLTQREHIEKIRRVPRPYYVGGLILGIVVLWLITMKLRLISPKYLHVMMIYGKSVPDTPYGNWAYIIFAGIYVYASYMSVMVFGAVSGKQTAFSTVGKNSASIYLGQALVYLILLDLGKSGFVSRLPISIYLFWAITTLATVLLFGNRYTGNAFRAVIAWIQRTLFPVREADGKEAQNGI